MRIRNLWVALWLGLVGGSLFAAALWLPASPWPSSDRAARAGPPAVASLIDVGRLARERAQAALHAVLGDARARAAKLAGALRRYRRRERLVASTLASLRELKLAEAIE